MTQVISNANVNPRNVRKLTIIELINERSIRVVCKNTCIIEVIVILNAIEKPNDNASILASLAYVK